MEHSNLEGLETELIIQTHVGLYRPLQVAYCYLASGMGFKGDKNIYTNTQIYESS